MNQKKGVLVWDIIIKIILICLRPLNKNNIYKSRTLKNINKEDKET